MSTNCDACDKECSPLACAKCRQAFYCSKECQKAHWKNHKKYCGFRKEETLEKMGPNFILDLRMFFEEASASLLAPLAACKLRVENINSQVLLIPFNYTQSEREIVILDQLIVMPLSDLPQSNFHSSFEQFTAAHNEKAGDVRYIIKLVFLPVGDNTDKTVRSYVIEESRDLKDCESLIPSILIEKINDASYRRELYRISKQISINQEKSFNLYNN
jgi:hypothetical protein